MLPGGGMESVAKITLDADTFRALASSTRLTVLKALDERRKTLTELSRDLALNKATVHEHMQLLTAAGLVRKRDDEGRKWIYYELTWTGQRILHPEATTTFNLLLGLSVAAAGGGVAMLGRALGWWFAAHHPVSSGDSGPQALNAPAGAQEQAATADTGPSSGAGSGSASGSASGSYTGSAGNSMPAEDSSKQFALQQPEPSAGEHHGSYFFDDGGWLALALIVACIVFLVLGWAVRRKLKPKGFDPDAAAAAEGPA
jgi:DNA-binding transcriptional ArsR family regulator